MPIIEPSVGQSNWGPVLNTALTQLDTIGPSAGSHTQTLASNGAVTIDASTGQYQKITLQANATSSSITNPVTGQDLTIEWLQDGTGGRTYAWPANIVWTQGVAPNASKGVNKADIFTFIYDGTNWVERSRIIGAFTAPFAPTAVGANSTSPPAVVVAAGSTDLRGSLTFGSGTAPVAGPNNYCNVTFGQALAAVPAAVVLTPTTGAAAALNDYLASFSATGFNIGFNTTIGTSQGATVYGFAWAVIL